MPHFDRPVPARLQRVPQLGQEPQLAALTGLDLGHGHPVDARGLRPGVSGHPLQSADQERRIIDEVKQVTETAGGIFSRPAVQLGLHPPYHDAGREIIWPGHGAGIHRRIFGHYIPFLD